MRIVNHYDLNMIDCVGGLLKENGMVELGLDVTNDYPCEKCDFANVSEQISGLIQKQMKTIPDPNKRVILSIVFIVIVIIGHAVNMFLHIWTH
jgi:hypothetical protein